MNTIHDILIVVDSLDVNASSGARANFAIVRNLAEQGFNVRVLHYSRREIAIEGVTSVCIPERKFNILYYLSRGQRVLQRSFGIELSAFLERRFGFSFTFFNDVSGIRKTVMKEVAPDLTITLSQGGSFRPHAALLCLPHLHGHWMAYIHDPFPFHFYPRPYNWVEVAYRQKEAFMEAVSQRARWSAFPSLLLNKWMSSYFPAFGEKSVVIPHQIHHSAFDETGLPVFFEKGKFYMLHAGSLLKQRSPEGLLKGFSRFLERRPGAVADARLILLGPAGYHERLLDRWRGKDSIILHDASFPFDATRALQRSVQVNIILEAQSEISPFLPGKFPHCIESGSTILHLGPKYSESMRLLGSDYPYHAEADDFKAIASLVERLYDTWKRNPYGLRLDRPDLVSYLSSSHMKDVIQGLAT